MIYSMLLLFILLFSPSTFAKKVSITIDDSVADDGAIFTSIQRSKTIINALNEQKVGKVLFFTITNRLKSKESKTILKSYIENGHLIGNHTHSHMSSSRIHLKDFILDISKADKILKELNIQSQYFRFPYLDRGKSKQSTSRFITYLNKSNIIDSYVTVVSNDWFLDELVQEDLHLGNEIDFNELKKLYISDIISKMKEIDRVSKNIKQSDINQVLLIHENDTTAIFLGDLIKSIRKEGWEIVNADQPYLTQNYLQFNNDSNNKNGRVCSLLEKKSYNDRCKFLPTRKEIENKYEKNVQLDEKHSFSLEYFLHKIKIHMREFNKYYFRW